MEAAIGLICFVPNETPLPNQPKSPPPKEISEQDGVFLASRLAQGQAKSAQEQRRATPADRD
jgi:hypothetical protein